MAEKPYKWLSERFAILVHSYSYNNKNLLKTGCEAHSGGFVYIALCITVFGEYKWAKK